MHARAVTHQMHGSGLSTRTQEPRIWLDRASTCRRTPDPLLLLAACTSHPGTERTSRVKVTPARRFEPCAVANDSSHRRDSRLLLGIFVCLVPVFPR